MFSEIMQAITEIAPDGLGGAIGRTLGDVFIAEDEIEKAQVRHPKESEAIWETFRSLERPEVLYGKSEELYRAHCHELLDRVAKGDDIDIVTRAEAVAVLSEMTFKSRLIPDAENLYIRLFQELGGLGWALPAEHAQTVEAMENQWNWDIDGQNRVFTKIARRLDCKRPRSDRVGRGDNVRRKS